MSVNSARLLGKQKAQSWHTHTHRRQGHQLTVRFPAACLKFMFKQKHPTFWTQVCLPEPTELRLTSPWTLHHAGCCLSLTKVTGPYASGCSTTQLEKNLQHVPQDRVCSQVFQSLCSSIRLVVLGSSQSQPTLSWINKGGWKQNNNIDLRKDVSSVRDADSDAALFCFRRTKQWAVAASAGWLAWKTKARSLQSFALLTCCCLVVMTPRHKQEDTFSYCDNDRQLRTQTDDYTDSQGR